MIALSGLGARVARIRHPFHKSGGDALSGKIHACRRDEPVPVRYAGDPLKPCACHPRAIQRYREQNSRTAPRPGQPASGSPSKKFHTFQGIYVFTCLVKTTPCFIHISYICFFVIHTLLRTPCAPFPPIKSNKTFRGLGKKRGKSRSRLRPKHTGPSRCRCTSQGVLDDGDHWGGISRGYSTPQNSGAL
jgi:hypothetical protein